MMTETKAIYMYLDALGHFEHDQVVPRKIVVRRGNQIPVNKK